MSELVEIATVFKAVFEKRPLPPLQHLDGDPQDDWITECTRRENHVLSVICNELRATGKAAVLVAGGQRIDLPAHDLHQAHAHYLADYSILSTLAWSLRAYAKYERAVVYIPEAVKVRAVKTATEELGITAKRGRPGKVKQVRAAYKVRFPKGHEAEGIPLKAVSAAIGVEADVRTIQRALCEE